MNQEKDDEKPLYHERELTSGYEEKTGGISLATLPARPKTP